MKIINNIVPIEIVVNIMINLMSVTPIQTKSIMTFYFGKALYKFQSSNLEPHLLTGFCLNAKPKF